MFVHPYDQPTHVRGCKDDVRHRKRRSVERYRKRLCCLRRRDRLFFSYNVSTEKMMERLSTSKSSSSSSSSFVVVVVLQYLRSVGRSVDRRENKREREILERVKRIRSIDRSSSSSSSSVDTDRSDDSVFWPFAAHEPASVDG